MLHVLSLVAGRDEGVPARVPGVEVKIDAEATQRPIQALLHGKLDIAIVSSEENDKRLTIGRCFEDEWSQSWRPIIRWFRVLI